MILSHFFKDFINIHEYANEKKAISNAYLIPPAHCQSIKKMMLEYKGHKICKKQVFSCIS